MTFVWGYLVLGTLVAIADAILSHLGRTGRLGLHVQALLQATDRHLPPKGRFAAVVLMSPLNVAGWLCMLLQIRKRRVCGPATEQLTYEESQERREQHIANGWAPEDVMAFKCEHGDHYHVARKSGIDPEEVDKSRAPSGK
jgi:hypothetical protein